MKRYTFSIVITVLLVAAFFLCIILFQRETASEGESYLVFEECLPDMQEAYHGR